MKHEGVHFKHEFASNKIGSDRRSGRAKEARGGVYHTSSNSLDAHLLAQLALRDWLVIISSSHHHKMKTT